MIPDLISPVPTLLLWAVIGYLAGSIPFGLVTSRLMGLGDVRQIGSGNIGATNVLRTGNKSAAALTLLLDGGKGAVVVLAARALTSEDAVQTAALMAFIGHCFPVWLGFMGGKGVATFLGILLAMAFAVGAAACATWLVTALAMRYSSLAALMAAILSAAWSAILGQPTMILLCAALAALILWRHSTNITRLRAGTEPKIGQKG